MKKYKAFFLPVLFALGWYGFYTFLPEVGITEIFMRPMLSFFLAALSCILVGHELF